MKKLQKWWRPALAIVGIVIALQVSVSLLVRTNRGHAYLIAHLERAFGRQVEVESFDARILPRPQLDANGVTVGEDPSFGYEYFLRAENLSTNLRLLGLLRGHFEFGTMALNKPSLILVRNSEGRWNLERWLPPAKTIPVQDLAVFGPASPVAPVKRLEKIEFDDGRINFKTGDDKLPFAFTGVSGSVEQILPGRWQLQLSAQPSRSGVSLQSAGTIKVLGDVAGTSARLQPAGITLHWSDASLADVLRLFRGQDYGVRGTFALDATAKSGAAKDDLAGDWDFSIRGRTGQIHRWDLAERADNPWLNLRVNGRWNIGSGSFVAEELAVEGPKSNLRGQLRVVGGSAPSMELRLDSLGIQASDLLAWYRSFHPDVVEGVTAENFLKLSAAFGRQLNRGWELTGQATAVIKWEWKQPFTGRWNGRIGFSKANLSVAGLNQPLRISESALDWVDGRRIARVMRVEGFGGTWTGNIEQPAESDDDNGPKWICHLRADQLNAADLDLGV